MSFHTPTYTFITTGEQRFFHHRWHGDEEVLECDACYSVCDKREAYSQHWQGNVHSQLKLSPAQCSQLRFIDARNVECFMLCMGDGAAPNGTHEFLVEAGTNAVPQLLRWMFCEVQQLRVMVSFYVRISNEDFIFESSELGVLHHFDINESVEVLFAMLVERVKRYTHLRHATNADDFSVRRLRINVKRIRRDGQFDLPLQYRIKGATNAETHTTNKDKDASAAIAAAYRRAQQQQRSLEKISSFENKPIHDVLLAGINLYGFQICRNSLELFVVPHQLHDVARYKDTPSYVILEDVTGKFQGLRHITRMRRFLRHDMADRVLTCRKCQATFMKQTKFALHKMLSCGRDFEVVKMPPDFIEMYRECVSLKSESYQWALYAIVLP